METLYELKEDAEKKGISGFSHARKKDIIYALDHHLDHVPYDMRDQAYRREHVGGSRNFQTMTLYELQDLARGKVPYSGRNKNTLIKELEKYYAQQRVGGAPKDLDSMTVPELKAYARDHGMSGYSKLRKQELIDRIKESNMYKRQRVGCGACASR